MTDSTQIDQGKDFDNIMEAVSKGDHAALNKLMESEPNPNPAVQEPATHGLPDTAPEPSTEAPEGGTPAEPAPSATPEPAEPVPAEPAAQGEPVEVDWKAEAERLKQEVHRYKSDAGRVPFTQKRINELEREIATLKATEAAKTAAGNEEVELDAETKAVIDELKTTDPVMARALETVAKKAVSTATAKVTSAFNEYSGATQEAENQRYIAEQYAVLTQQIPQAPQIFASNEWKQWKAGLSPNRLRMAESKHADEVAIAIHAFAADMQRAGLVPAPTPEAAAAPAAPVPTPEQNEAALRAVQERTRRVTAAAEVPAAAARTAEEFDEEKAYLEMFDKIAKANHIK